MPAGERNDVATVGGPDSMGGFSGVMAEMFAGTAAPPEQWRGPRVPPSACHGIWQTGQIPLTSGAGTLQQSNLYGPELGYVWDLRSVSFWGFSAGSVTIYVNSTSGEEIGNTTSAGQFTWSAQTLLQPQDSLIFVASGVTGVVNLTVRAIEIEEAWLGEYLM